jgi:hypothetical protein
MIAIVNGWIRIRVRISHGDGGVPVPIRWDLPAARFQACRGLKCELWRARRNAGEMEQFWVSLLSIYVRTLHAFCEIHCHICD